MLKKLVLNSADLYVMREGMKDIGPFEVGDLGLN